MARLRLIIHRTCLVLMVLWTGYIGYFWLSRYVFNARAHAGEGFVTAKTVWPALFVGWLLPFCFLGIIALLTRTPRSSGSGRG